MQMNEITFETARPIDGYAPGGFRVGGIWRHGSLLLAAQWWEGWPATAPDGITAASLGRVLRAASDIDVLLVGTGPEIALIDADVRGVLEKAGIGVETMSTPSACRTYNVLLAEGRRVAAALIAM